MKVYKFYSKDRKGIFYTTDKLFADFMNKGITVIQRILLWLYI